MKREQLLQRLRKDAKAAGSSLVIEMVRFKDKFAVVQSGEISPVMEKTIRKQLGL